MKIVKLNPSKCIRWNFANRSNFEFGDLAALARDIKLNGQVEPVLARPIKGSNKYDYEIVAGARRWKACLEFDLPLHAIVKDWTDLEAFHHQMKENDKAPLSDYSIGLNFAKMIAQKNITIAEISSLTGYSRTKVNNLLTFAKVPEEIWDVVADMSRVSSCAAEMIFRLSNKGDKYIDALKEIAEHIKKGAGAKKIEALVLTIVLGENAKLEYRKKIVAPSGQVLGYWIKNGIEFEKGVNINQSSLEQAIIANAI